MKPELYNSNTNYIICPDDSCKLFWDTSKRPFACDGYCPHGDKMQMMVVCFKCKKEIYLDPKHCSTWQRVDCSCGASSFVRLSGVYRLIRNGNRKID